VPHRVRRVRGRGRDLPPDGRDRKPGLPLGDRDCTGPGGPVGGGGAIPRRPTGRKPCLPLGDRDCTGHGASVGGGAIPVPTDGHPRESASREVVAANAASSHPFDPDGSHMLVSEIKPCTCKYASRTTETADGSLNQLRPTRSHRPRLHRITVVILELIRAPQARVSARARTYRTRNRRQAPAWLPRRITILTRIVVPLLRGGYAAMHRMGF
jgi:hypothetical protein